MSPDVCFLITILTGTELMRCALKVRACDLPGDCREHYWMEPENRSIILHMLPDHVGSAGPIVQIEEIFEVKDRS